MERKFNPQLEAVIAESKNPEFVRALVAALVDGAFNEDAQGHAMALLQESYDVDLFDLGLAFVSEKTPDEIRKIAETGEIY